MARFIKRQSKCKKHYSIFNIKHRILSYLIIGISLLGLPYYLLYYENDISRNNRPSIELPDSHLPCPALGIGIRDPHIHMANNEFEAGNFRAAAQYYTRAFPCPDEDELKLEKLKMLASEIIIKYRKQHTALNYTYRIKPGDTLTDVAAKYHTTVQSLIEFNKIKNPNLIISGQALRIPRLKTNELAVQLNTNTSSHL